MKTIHENQRRRLPWRSALCAGIALAATVAMPGTADAYNLQPVNDSSGTQICSYSKFPDPNVRVIVHLTESKVDLVQAFQLVNALEKVDAQLDNVGASLAHVTSVTTTYDAFSYGTFYGDTVPTIHIGFTPTLPKNGIGSTAYGPVVKSTCTYEEAEIAFLDMDAYSWNFGTPDDTGEAYYDANYTDNVGATWFRSAYQHELLHAFGLSHSATSYAFMNYGAKPWANRDDDAAIMPLPDDVQALRFLYPTTGTRYDVAVLNTWYDENNQSTGSQPAAIQAKLCLPSVGTAFLTSRFTTYCGNDSPAGGVPQVAKGDKLRTRFAVANYSTDKVQLTAKVWFSLDDQWDAGDIQSKASFKLAAGAGNSAVAKVAWTVPALAGAAGTIYHPIIRVEGTFDSDPAAYVVDWNPLRGSVQVR